MNINRIIIRVLWIVVLTFWSCPNHAAILHTADFSVDASGWHDNAAGGMAVTHDALNDWMTLSFSAQGFPIPETGSLVYDSGPNFLGNYVSLGITQISFDFYAADVLPSELSLVLQGAGETFTYTFFPAFVGSFDTYTVDLLWSYGWDGIGESAFNTAVRDVTAIEIQITRSGTGLQYYYIDNISTYDTPLDEPVGGVVPEPQTLSLFAVAAFLIYAMRHRRFRIAGAAGTSASQDSGMILPVILILLGVTTSTNAASPTMTDFQDQWSGRLKMGAGYWTLGGGEARISFVDTTPTPLPDAGILSVSPDQLSFTGDYEQSGISVMGFQFMAPTELPSGHVVLEWSGGNASFQRGFTVLATGVWHHFTASMDVQDAGTWVPVLGSHADFAEARRSVSNVTIRINRTGTTARDYVVRDLFIAAKPTGSSLVRTNQLLRMSADNLLPGKSYLLETAGDLHGPWMPAVVVTATNIQQWINITNDAPSLFLRFRFP